MIGQLVTSKNGNMYLVSRLRPEVPMVGFKACLLLVCSRSFHCQELCYDNFSLGCDYGGSRKLCCASSSSGLTFSYMRPQIKYVDDVIPWHLLSVRIGPGSSEVSQRREACWLRH